MGMERSYSEYISELLRLIPNYVVVFVSKRAGILIMYSWLLVLFAFVIIYRY